MSGANSADAFKLTVDPRNDRYDPDDDRWLPRSPCFTRPWTLRSTWSVTRGRDRRVDIRWNSDGVERSVTLTGEAIDVDTMRDVALAAASRVGGPPWPADTGHS